MSARRYYVTTRQMTHIALTNVSGRTALCGAALAAGLDWSTKKPAKVCAKCVEVDTPAPMVPRGAVA